MKVAFVDRDGTINKDYQDNTWRYISEPELIEGSVEALKAISQKGYQIIIVTNQYLINEGIIRLLQYKKFTEKLLLELNDNGIKILDIFYCPHSRDENCNCHKPKTGLIDMSLKKYPHVDLDKSFIVGDSISDVELGNKIDVMTFGINVESGLLKYTKVESLSDIIKYL
ncbi:MAG: HAD-IIIA family hydrolase [Gudongella sp.]|nr:HAD-IIIA family hydrolase [Gudongella sp.]